MDWRVFMTTFGVIFLAEMGDKTQLAAMTMAANTKRPIAVFIGAALALVLVSAIGVVVGGVVVVPLVPDCSSCVSGAGAPVMAAKASFSESSMIVWFPDTTMTFFSSGSGF